MLDITIVISFILYSLYTGSRNRRVASKSLKEYFLAGHSIPGYKAGTSMAATQFAADTPLLFVGLIATAGVFMLWQLWVYGLAFLLMGFVFSPMWRRANVLTDAELTHIRYSGAGTNLLRGIKAIYYGTVINCVVLAFVLVATFRIAEIFLPWNLWLAEYGYSFFIHSLELLFPQQETSALIIIINNTISLSLLITFTTLYTTTGGLRAVINTDIAQFFFALIATASYAYLLTTEVGGLQQIIPNLTARYDQAFVEQHLSFIPPSNQALLPFFTLLGLQWLFQMNSDGTGYLAQRSMACRSDQDAKQAAIIFAWLQVVLRSLIWLLIGVSLLLLYPLDPSVPNEILKSERELTFLYGINDILPAGLKGLMLTGLLAALASTIDTHLNWGASYWSNDIYKFLYCEQWRKKPASDRTQVKVARIANFVILFFALLVMTQLDSIQQGWKTSLLFGAGVGSVLVMRWLWEKVTLWCELGAMLFSLFAGIALLHWLPADHQEWLRLLIMATGSTTIVVLLALYGPQTSQQQLSRFYSQVQPLGFWNNTEQYSQLAHTSLARLKKQLLRTGFAATTLFCTLIAITRLLLPLPNTQVLWFWGLLFFSLLLTPLWLKKED